MQVKNGIVLPTAGFESINPKIQDSEKVRIAEMPLPWPENEPRRCLVTNFGKADTKFHLGTDSLVRCPGPWLTPPTLRLRW